jgi:hypothetical protein
MNKNLLFTLKGAGISVISLLLVVGTLAFGLLTITITATSATAAYAQTQTTLGEIFFDEKGKITGQKEIGDNRTQLTYSTNGTMKGNIEVTNSGDWVSVSKGNNVTYGYGQGVITTKDGSEKANYTFHLIGNITDEGKPVSRGSTVYSTNSTGNLAFLDNVITIFKIEGDEMGNFVSKDWEWK